MAPGVIARLVSSFEDQFATTVKAYTPLIFSNRILNDKYCIRMQIVLFTTRIEIPRTSDVSLPFVALRNLKKFKKKKKKLRKFKKRKRNLRKKHVTRGINTSKIYLTLHRNLQKKKKKFSFTDESATKIKRIMITYIYMYKE